MDLDGEIALRIAQDRRDKLDRAKQSVENQERQQVWQVASDLFKRKYGAHRFKEADPEQSETARYGVTLPIKKSVIGNQMLNAKIKMVTPPLSPHEEEALPMTPPGSLEVILVLAQPDQDGIRESGVTEHPLAWLYPPELDETGYYEADMGVKGVTGSGAVVSADPEIINVVMQALAEAQQLAP